MRIRGFLIRCAPTPSELRNLVVAMDDELKRRFKPLSARGGLSALFSPLMIYSKFEISRDVMAAIQQRGVVISATVWGGEGS